MDGDKDTHGDHHGAQHVYGRAAGLRRVEVISGVERRRRWDRDEKSRIIAESFSPGVNVSDLARRNGVSIGLLHQWRRAARTRPVALDQTFVPLLAIRGEDGPKGGGDATIEIETSSGRIRVVGAVDLAALRVAIASMRGG